MRILPTILLVALLLVGCQTFSNLLPTSFDPVEYDRYVVVQRLVVSANSKCASPSLIKQTILPSLDEAIQTLILYTWHKHHDTDLFKSILGINDIVVEMRLRYATDPPPSLAYCKAKLELVRVSTDRALSVLGDATK